MGMGIRKRRRLGGRRGVKGLAKNTGRGNVLPDYLVYCLIYLHHILDFIKII